MSGSGAMLHSGAGDIRGVADDAPSYVRAMEQAWVEASSSSADARNTRGTPLIDRSYSFAGRPVRLRVLGARFGERTHRAFLHLRRSESSAGALPTAYTNSSAGLVIELWDEHESGVPMPAEPHWGEPERTWIACGGTLTAYGGGRYVAFRFGDSVTLLDRRAQRMIGCRRDGSSLCGGEYSKPLLLMLSIWYYDRGVQLLHAGALARDGAAVLLPGESGTGKSTTCLAAVVQGLQYVGDDFIGLERSPEGRLFVHSVYGTGCVWRSNLTRFESIQGYVVDDDAPGDEKPIVFVPEIFPERLSATAEVRAIALLSVGHAQTEVQPASRVEALRQFAASTLHTLVPRPGREALEMIAGVVERVPAYRLMLGPDLQDIAPSIDRIFEAASAKNAV